MAGFDPVEWTERFERLGGLVSVRHAKVGSRLWTGVIQLSPNRREAEVMKAELDDHPDWQGLLVHYAEERLGAVQQA
jgi:hypothetical protein